MKHLKKFNESSNKLWKTMSWNDIVEDLKDIFIDLLDKDLVKEIKSGTKEGTSISTEGVFKTDVDYFYITIYLPGVLESQIGWKELYKAGKGDGPSNYKTFMSGYINQANLLKERLEEIYNCIERSNKYMGFMPSVREEEIDKCNWALKITYERRSNK